MKPNECKWHEMAQNVVHVQYFEYTWSGIILTIIPPMSLIKLLFFPTQSNSCGVCPGSTVVAAILMRMPVSSTGWMTHLQTRVWSIRLGGMSMVGLDIPSSLWNRVSNPLIQFRPRYCSEGMVKHIMLYVPRQYPVYLQSVHSIESLDPWLARSWNT